MAKWSYKLREITMVTWFVRMNADSIAARERYYINYRCCAGVSWQLCWLDVNKWLIVFAGYRMMLYENIESCLTKCNFIFVFIENNNYCLCGIIISFSNYRCMYTDWQKKHSFLLTEIHLNAYAHSVKLVYPN